MKFCMRYGRHNVVPAEAIPNLWPLRSIHMRKPPIVAEGTKQELSHELEVVLVHHEADRVHIISHRRMPKLVHFATVSR